MLGNPFYNAASRNLVVVFGNLFNNITLIRRNADGSEHDRIKVNIDYALKQKWYISKTQDPNNEKKLKVALPQISFQITGVNYDSSRKQITTNKMYATGDPDSSKTVFMGSPINYTIEMNIYAQSAEDAFQIVEQIIPYFTPTFTVQMNTLPTMGLVTDIPITLKSINPQDFVEGTFDIQRAIQWNLVFEARHTLYGPITDAKVIKKAIVDMHVASGDGPVTDEQVATTPRAVRITTQPDPLDANANDDFGFSIVITEYDDNKHYDPVTGTDVPVPGGQSVTPPQTGPKFSIPTPVVTP